MKKILKPIEYFFVVNYTIPRIWSFLKTFLFLLGASWTLIELTSWILDAFPTEDTNKTYSDLFRNWLISEKYYALTLLTLASFYRNRKKISTVISVNGSDLEIEFKFCDIYKQKGATVLPLMDTFDTSLDNNLVDSNSLHGQLITKYYSGKVTNLDTEITTSLQRVGYTPTSTSQSLPGKKDKYDIGTTAIAQPNSKYFYLTVLTTMTDSGNVTIQPEYIVDFLANLWQFIPQHGRTHKIVNIPIIGKGINRLPAEYTHQRIAQEIANSFITTSGQGTFCQKLRICIYPYDAKYIDTKKLTEYIKHLIEYNFK
jgi:hypothetical protein